MMPLEWDVKDVSAWYQLGSAEIDGRPEKGEAQFRNDKTGEIVFHIPGRIFEADATKRSYLVPFKDFSADQNFPADTAIAELVNGLLHK